MCAAKRDLVQVELAAAAEYLPEAQLVHEPEPVVEEYLPAVH